MYDLQSYLGKMSAGLVSNNKIMQSKYGKKKRQKTHYTHTSRDVRVERVEFGARCRPPQLKHVREGDVH